MGYIRLLIGAHPSVTRWSAESCMKSVLWGITEHQDGIHALYFGCFTVPAKHDCRDLCVPLAVGHAGGHGTQFMHRLVQLQHVVCSPLV